MEAQMRVRFSVSISWLFLLVLIASGSVALGQAGLDVFVTPIPNAPFSGTINVARSIVNKDGSIVYYKTVRDIHRDSRGRIYTESRNLLPAASTDTPQVLGIHLYDPQTRTNTFLYPQNHTFVTGTVDRPPATAPPAFLQASPTGNALPQNEFTKEEDLGIQQMEGLPLHGIRETQTIPNGSGKDILVVDEYWYSADLRINMVIKHNDPRTGGVIMTVTHVTRSEPDPALLEIPEGYAPARVGREASK
jgi:hypothetical protein